MCTVEKQIQLCMGNDRESIKRRLDQLENSVFVAFEDRLKVSCLTTVSLAVKAAHA